LSLSMAEGSHYPVAVQMEDTPTHMFCVIGRPTCGIRVGSMRGTICRTWNKVIVFYGKTHKEKV